MKKFLALLLAVLMIASMSVTAFAEEVTDTVEGDKTGTVKVQVTDENGNDFNGDPTYFVEIVWTGLTFDLKVANTSTDVKWNGTVYEITGGKWDTAASHNVKVTNKSNAVVYVDANFATGKSSAEKHGITATVDGAQTPLAAAVNITPESKVFNISLSAAPTTLPELSFDVDTITVTVKTTAN